MDSLATEQIPAVGYGLRYEYGIFKQNVEDGWQVEQPDHWLRYPDPWEVMRPDRAVPVKLGCAFELHRGEVRIVLGKPTTLYGIAYDRPVVGFGGQNVNTLRLWGAATANDFDFQQFSSGDVVGALVGSLTAESLTRVLYPDDSTMIGRGLRFLQEYFLVACSLGDVVRRFRRRGLPWAALPEHAAIQMNDTHPAMAVPELMRILLDQGNLPWDEAWCITQETLGYTNHTLLPEALEQWPVQWFEHALPRILEITYEINRRFLGEVGTRFPDDDARLRRMSIIEESEPRSVRMAHLATAGSHRVNGVAAIHSQLLRTRVLNDFAELWPDRFTNVTNGVTHRRWLMQANPALSRVITGAIGDGWIQDLSQLERLKPLADDPALGEEVREAKRQAKARFADWLQSAHGESVDPDSIFDVQIKRIHEYKRQLLNALHIVTLYDRLREDPHLDLPPRTFFFSGKAAPSYRLAKLVIKLIHGIAGVVNRDPAVKGRLKVLFLPDYSVSLAERLIPAADVSEQISTAGFEASGTSNMKFMMNGALTIGTLDGATIEMAESAGPENFFLFGLTADQVERTRGWYDPRWHHAHEPRTREAIDAIALDKFSRGEPGVFIPIIARLLDEGDRYLHLADLRAYSEAQERVATQYGDPQGWTAMVLRNIAASGPFSSDRTVAEYARKIWRVTPCPVD
jgi:starch phosphorylase